MPWNDQKCFLISRCECGMCVCYMCACVCVCVCGVGAKGLSSVAGITCMPV